MCTVSIIDFNNNPSKYLEIAKQEKVVIEGDKETFELVMNTCREGFITADELKENMRGYIKTMFEKRKQVISDEDLANGISGKELIAAISERIDQFADK